MATISKRAFFIALAMFMNVAVSADKVFRTGSVYCKEAHCTFKDSVVDTQKATAYGSFNDTLLKTGWGVLDIVAGGAHLPGQTDTEIMFAAGFLEGVFTARQMEYNYQNMHDAFHLSTAAESKLSAFFYKQRSWVDMMVKANADDPLWRQASYVNAQLDGLLAGYKSVRKGFPKALNMYAVTFLNSIGDLIDLTTALNLTTPLDWTKFTPAEAEEYFYTNGHCSALIKLLPGFENIYMSHSSWFVYAATNRIYKHYNLNLGDASAVAKRMSFSSYAGYLESLDDFYQLSSGMVMLQTTNNVFNRTLYKLVKPESLMAWQRVRMANMMASSGREWAQVFAMYNSGTYNNQYMIIDLKLVQPGKPVPDNTLWVAEQIPGLVVADDLTELLRLGYYASYNVPYFEEIYNKSGYPEYVKLHGVQYTHQLAPRAKIFRRDQSKVKDLDSMKAIMRYNDFKHDPYSGGSPWGAICGRGDLIPGKPSYSGCYDTKVADYNMSKAFLADAISGPTLGDDFPPFSWTGAATKLPHAGLPHVYNFPFLRTQPRFKVEN